MIKNKIEKGEEKKRQRRLKSANPKGSEGQTGSSVETASLRRPRVGLTLTEGGSESTTTTTEPEKCYTDASFARKMSVQAAAQVEKEAAVVVETPT
jgi:hypothetical protein